MMREESNQISKINPESKIMSKNRRTILILADVNVRAAIATLRALNNKDLSVHLCFNARARTNRALYRRYTTNIPFYYDKTSEKAFINSLISIKTAIGEYILLPYGEELLRWAIKRKDDLKREGVSLPTVDFEKYILVSNKESFIDLCKNSGINVRHEIDEEWSRFKEKFVVKPKKLIINERCLKYPVLVENRDSFQNLKVMDIDMTKHLTQEYIDGPSIYYCAYCEKGAVKLSFVQKNIVQQPAGKSVIKAVPYNLPEDMIGKIKKMLHHVDWEGVIMIEVKEDLKTNEYYAIEANPRFWGPLQIAIDNGVNFPAALLGLDVEKNKPKYPIGYLWLGGYISGFFIKLQTKTNFQKFRGNDLEGIAYRDIWLRKDTYPYFFMEQILSVVGNFRKIYKSSDLKLEIQRLLRSRGIK